MPIKIVAINSSCDHHGKDHSTSITALVAVVQITVEPSGGFQIRLYVAMMYQLKIYLANLRHSHSTVLHYLKLVQLNIYSVICAEPSRREND